MCKQELVYSMICALMEKVKVLPWKYLGMVPIPDFCDQGRIQGERDT